MKPRDVDAAMAAANPFNREQVADLSLAAAEDELLSEILAERVPAPSRATQRSTRLPGRRPTRLTLAAAALATGLLAFFLISGGDEGRPMVQPSSAYAAELVRFADASPRLLIAAPGWHVEGLRAGYGEGEMQFVHGDAPVPEEGVPYGLPVATRQRKVELTWTPTSRSSLESRVGDRAYGSEDDTAAPVLNTTARVFQYSERAPEDLDITALWQEEGLVVEYRAQVPSMETFKAQLSLLRKVDARAWLTAMPPSVVKPDEYERTVGKMLDGIALPPGFTASDVAEGSVPTDRYQLGATVAGSVSCTWFARWAEARRSGDRAEVNASIAAMATAKEWPILRQMTREIGREGGYTQAVTDFAAAMPRGSIYKQRPLEGDIESALGCGRLLGIQIPGTGFYDRAHISG
jgi:hypothetical protein